MLFILVKEIVLSKKTSKVIEESPAILLNDETRTKLHDVAVKSNKIFKI